MRECAGDQREHKARAAVGHKDAACEGVTVHHLHRLCCYLVFQQGIVRVSDDSKGGICAAPSRLQCFAWYEFVFG